MSLLLYLKRLFSLDTLDTRFTTSSWTPSAASTSAKPARTDPAKPLPGLDVQDGASNGHALQSKGRDTPQPSKWTTPEFFLYYAVIIVAVSLMIKSIYDVSIRERPRTYDYLRSLDQPHVERERTLIEMQLPIRTILNMNTFSPRAGSWGERWTTLIHNTQASGIIYRTCSSSSYFIPYYESYTIRSIPSIGRLHNIHKRELGVHQTCKPMRALTDECGSTWHSPAFTSWLCTALQHSRYL